MPSHPEDIYGRLKSEAAALDPIAAPAVAGGAQRRQGVAQYYTGLGAESSLLGQQSQAALDSAAPAGAQVSRNLSTALVATNAGRNPLMAQQGALDAGREHATIRSDVRQEAAGYAQLQREMDTRIAEEKAAELTEGEDTSRILGEAEERLRNFRMTDPASGIGPKTSFEIHDFIVAQLLPTATTQAAANELMAAAKYWEMRGQGFTGDQIRAALATPDGAPAANYVA